MRIFEELSGGELCWLPEIGIGYYPVVDSPYDESYFAKYQQMENTEIGLALNKARIELVAKYTSGEVVDVGIGSGAFVSKRENTKGYDINKTGIDWLVSREKYFDITNKVSRSATFWDSLEHIHNPSEILRRIEELAFVSIPIFTDANHILKSRHFRKEEHCWYFTESGLVLFMKKHGFVLIESNRMESEIGREDIGTFVFRKSSDDL